ncbi:MAG: AMP-binding protein [Oscillospiraceae bacterium]|jgi:acetyl-CoA synthetase|nr:AMP-binding protein [Oscillospiraceae bacterium]
MNFYKRFCNEVFDEKGLLKKLTFKFEPNFNFAYDVVDELAAQNPDKTAMLWTDDYGTEKIFTFADLKKQSTMAANYFLSLGIARGDTVMLVLKRHWQFWVAVLALHRIGAVGIPATNLLTKKDYIYRFNAAQVKAIVATTDGEVVEHIDSALSQSPSLKIRISAKGTSAPGWSDFDAEYVKFPDTMERIETKHSDPFLLYFTSGTTGMPKMVWHDFTYPLGHIITAKYWHNVNPDGMHFTISDTGWMKAMWGKIYGQWLCEGAVFVRDFDKFTPADLLPLFKKHSITTFCAPPTMYRFFIQEDLSKYDLSTLEHISTAGEPLNAEVYNKMLEMTGLRLMEGFGQTETTLTLFNQVGTIPKPGSMGIPSPAWDVDIVDLQGNSVPTGTVGEIVIRTDKSTPCGMFGGYYQDPELTKTVWYDDIYHTGDTAWQDEDGFYWFVGRTDDVIKSSGYRIGPFEVESAILEHPACVECAVTGVPDPVRGQLVKATIILAKGYAPSDELKKEIQNFVKQNTAPYKYPRVVEFVDELPKTISGKIRRAEIRDNDKN